MNSLYQQITGMTGRNQSLLTNMKQVRQMWDNLKSIGNPQQMLQNALQQNPELKQIIDSSGGDYKKAFYTYANKLGVNGDELLQMLK